MSNIKTLKPINELTAEEAKKRGRNGGKKSVEVRRKRKQAREQLELLLSMPLQDIKDKNGRSLKSQLQTISGVDDIDNQMAMMVSLFKTVLFGGKNSVQAFNSLMTIAGENMQKVEITKGTGETIDEIDKYLGETDVDRKSKKGD